MTRPDAAQVGRPVPVLGDAYTINLGPLFVGRVERSEALWPRAWAARWASLRVMRPTPQFTRRDSLCEELLDLGSTQELIYHG